ncbi:YaiO family outer membrane beta-barrel protein [Allosphingosinicella indica]|uniref:Outer membrane protein, YaiO family n=1 Tax=Allosphingosinicella indica TaxID=941907 RepID=A0A1X7FYN6_9SPHN|nr:YaiO family outer membrane beta-barrel protein [Allosphingosinicella indica]SMF61191.1 outer membrane protein, YaiO family [Allosphingosinicella indica]
MRAAILPLAAALMAAPLPAQTLTPELAYREAVAARQSGDAQRAVDLLGPLVAADPANADAQVQLGYALLALDRTDDAERAFQSALAAAPGYADAHIGQARIAQRRGDRAAALRALSPVGRDNADAEALRAQLRAPGEAYLWSLDIDGGYSFVEDPQPDWREGSLQIRRQANGRTGLHGRAEIARRFGNSDVYAELGLDHRLSDRARIYLTLGGTPGADFRPRYQIGAGGSVRISDGGDATALTLDARQAEFAGGDVQTLAPGIEQYFAGGRLWLTARWIHLFDETGRHQSGYLVRADGQATDRLRLFAGLSDAPDTSEGLVIDTRSFFGGVSFDVSSTTTLRLSLAHEDRDTGADRTQIGLGLGLRF